MMNIKKEVGRRLAEIRKEKGMTTYELADKTGIARPNIANIESGRYSSGIETLHNIVTALDYKIDFSPIDTASKTVTPPINGETE